MKGRMIISRLMLLSVYLLSSNAFSISAALLQSHAVSIFVLDKYQSQIRHLSQCISNQQLFYIDAFLIEKARRYDIKGKKYIASLSNIISLM